LLLTMDDVEGTYTIPYIQSCRELDASFRFDAAPVTTANVSLRLAGKLVAEKDVRGPVFRVFFPNLPWGEYVLEVDGLDREGRSLCRVSYNRIGIGIMLVALGDSIAEGYYGRGFWQDDLHLRAGKFPVDAVSKDGRNFPQFAATAKDHLPSVNCFESWMTRLNDSLSGDWRAPVFIANEGWGGIASGGYLEMMRNDARWRQRMRTLKPQLWLIHLGVNDERAKVPPEMFAANMEAIVNLLMEAYAAQPNRILVAQPCYDYFEGATEILTAYCKEIDGLTSRHGLGRGPDFFAAYATERERWYGEDPVHPNPEGMKRMAQLWRDAIVKAFPEGPKS
jgi:lysophospholipase L1-like esterase